jgi:hypothetical protein
MHGVNENYGQALLNTCTESLIKFIMHVWVNLDTIKYYEREDQMHKMINLLQGINTLLSSKKLETVNYGDLTTILIANLSSNSHHILRQIK